MVRGGPSNAVSSDLLALGHGSGRGCVEYGRRGNSHGRCHREGDAYPSSYKMGRQDGLSIGRLRFVCVIDYAACNIDNAPLNQISQMSQTLS